MMHVMSSKNKGVAMNAGHRIHVATILAIAFLFVGLGVRAGSCLGPA